MWIVVEIGCLECGYETHMVGRFGSLAAANEARERLEAAFVDSHGVEFKVFEVPEAEGLTEGYRQRVLEASC